jgi:hypothetical protein
LKVASLGLVGHLPRSNHQTLSQSKRLGTDEDKSGSGPVVWRGRVQDEIIRINMVRQCNTYFTLGSNHCAFRGSCVLLCNYHPLPPPPQKNPKAAPKRAALSTDKAGLHSFHRDPLMLTRGGLIKAAPPPPPLSWLFLA